MWLSLFLLFQISFAATKPITPIDSIELQKTAITISYNPKHKIADWVFYKLGPNELKNCVNRTGNFKSDFSVINGPTLEDYRGSGYDRGHLSPAGDNKWSEMAMLDSFFLTNITPQPRRFNVGIWSKLENLVRAWGGKNNGLWVVTGPILNEELETIGSGVSVPNSYYKVLITDDEKYGIGFILDVESSGNLRWYATSINEVENQSGLNFFPGIENEEIVERKVDFTQWDFQATPKYFPCENI